MHTPCAQGNILDDGEAVDVLQAAKKLSDEIAAKQKDAERTEVAIDKARTVGASLASPWGFMSIYWGFDWGIDNHHAWWVPHLGVGQLGGASSRCKAN